MAKQAAKTPRQRRKGRSLTPWAGVAIAFGAAAALALLGRGLQRIAHALPVARTGSRTEALLDAVGPLGIPMPAIRRGSGSVPFAYVNQHIFVSATLDGLPGTWLVDTGSNLTVISPRAADLAGCQAIAARAKDDPYGIARFVSVASLAVGGAQAPLRVAGIMLKLEDQILRSDGVLIDGILGFDWLEQFRIQVDYAHKTLALLPPGPPAAQRSHRFLVPLRLVDGLPLVPVRIDDGPTRDCLLDTGSNIVNLRWDLARASGIRPGDPSLRRGPRIAGLGASTNTQAALLSTLAVGPRVFRGVPVSLYAGHGVSSLFGNIGNTLFGSGRLTIDPGNHQVVLEP